MTDKILDAIKAVFPHYHSGKVREMFEIPNFPDLLLMYATDRLSTHNVVHLTPMPRKGEYLTALSIFWTMSKLSMLPTHLIAYGRDIYAYVPELEGMGSELYRRCVVVSRMEPDPYEYVWRRYLCGSLYDAYLAGEDPYGLNLPEGLPKYHRFDELVFTPTHKSKTDDPCDPNEVRRRFPASVETTQKAFKKIEDYLWYQGITYLDGKLEASNGCLIDEIGTGDCCRYAWAQDMKRRHSNNDPAFLDKEVARQLVVAKWDGGNKIPVAFTDAEAERVMARYAEAFVGITHAHLNLFQRERY